MTNVRQSDSSYHSSLQKNELENDFEGKPIDAQHPPTHGVVAPVSIR